MTGPGGKYASPVWPPASTSNWDPKNKAVVLDGKNGVWSRNCIGMPSLVQVGRRLAILYDAPGGDSLSHMNRDVELAWLVLPLVPPAH